jgi:hypothetical protein
MPFPCCNYITIHKHAAPGSSGCRISQARHRTGYKEKSLAGIETKKDQPLFSKALAFFTNQINILRKSPFTGDHRA